MFNRSVVLSLAFAGALLFGTSEPAHAQVAYGGVAVAPAYPYGYAAPYYPPMPVHHTAIRTAMRATAIPMSGVTVLGVTTAATTILPVVTILTAVAMVTVATATEVGMAIGVAMAAALVAFRGALADQAIEAVADVVRNSEYGSCARSVARLGESPREHNFRLSRF